MAYRIPAPIFNKLTDRVAEEMEMSGYGADDTPNVRSLQVGGLTKGGGSVEVQASLGADIWVTCQFPDGTPMIFLADDNVQFYPFNGLIRAFFITENYDISEDLSIILA